jgi:peptide/nickel transport system substrate-binding protein
MVKSSGTNDSSLTMAIPAAPISLNPAKGAYAEFPHSLSAGTIIRGNPDGTYSPNLATAWRYVGTGNTIFEFVLRHDLRFSDGSVLDAAAAAAWMNYFSKASTEFARQLGPIESIAAVAPDTVRIVLGAPNPDMVYYLSGPYNWGYLVSPEVIANPDVLNTQTFGAGPYVLDASQTVAGRSYTFLPNEYYFAQSSIKYKKIVVKVVTTPTSTLAALETGQVQFAVGDYETVGGATRAGLDVYSVPANTVGITFLDRNGEISEPLGNLQVRQALNYAVNRPLIVQDVIGKHGSPTSEFCSTDGFDPDCADYYSYDPSRAKELLASAGYADGFTFTTIVFDGPGTVALKVAEAMAQQFEAVGVTMRLKVDTAAEYVTDVMSGKFAAQVADNPISPQSVLYATYLAPSGIVNQLKVVDPALDALAKTASVASSPSDYWKQMSQLYTKQAVWCPVLIADTFYFAAESVGGIVAIRSDQLDPTVWYPR